MSVVAQHTSALAEANRIRLERARLRKDIRDLGYEAGRRRLAELILDPPECFQTAPVGSLLMCVHRFGNAKTSALLKSVDANPFRPLMRTNARGQLSPLTDRQRRVLAGRLERGEI